MASVYGLHDIVIHQREPVMRIIVLSIFLICAGVAAPAGAETQLADGDELEIVTLVGGG